MTGVCVSMSVHDGRHDTRLHGRQGLTRYSFKPQETFLHDTVLRYRRRTKQIQQTVSCKIESCLSYRTSIFDTRFKIASCLPCIYLLTGKTRCTLSGVSWESEMSSGHRLGRLGLNRGKTRCNTRYIVTRHDVPCFSRLLEIIGLFCKRALLKDYILQETRARYDATQGTSWQDTMYRVLRCVSRDETQDKVHRESRTPSSPEKMSWKTSQDAGWRRLIGSPKL